MKESDRAFAEKIRVKLINHSGSVRELKGINNPNNLDVLLFQIVESKRRVDYVKMLNQQEMSYERANPKSEMFDPIKAAVLMRRIGDINEACWLAFLAIHFGKNSKNQWSLSKGVYGSLDDEMIWSWENVTSNTDEFIQWLSDNHIKLGRLGKFGNHRKYESLNPKKRNWNGAIIKSYIDWVCCFGDHLDLIKTFEEKSINEKDRFKMLYKSMSSVLRFGRTAKFDYLTMLGKLDIMDIEADSTYMSEATGPKRGANLLFFGTRTSSYSPELLEKWISDLDIDLNIGMQIIEDSLCNWQKSPNEFIKFRG
ncbi:hypothetical protein [Aeromonas hydrophila]|uniref:alpha-glutamyl/putrescinyl thymine pyrophosphorylase clade 3 protein n=1 Tax=Aeromonas hydrophila TaxID=644 RepID=UPI0023625E6D|nr:hypothetical protein [Aeromonas hydrophila]